MPTPPTDPATCDFCSYWFNGPAHRPSPQYRRMGYPTDHQRPCHESVKALTAATRTLSGPAPRWRRRESTPRHDMNHMSLTVAFA
jgi:hypothetical protein